MTWLTYHPDRRKVWTEHSCFPHGAIKWCNDNIWNYDLNQLRIYEVNEDRTEIWFIPREEWPDVPTK